MSTRCAFRHQRTLAVLFALLGLTVIPVPSFAQFETRATRPLPDPSFAVATGDFNRDGKLDVAIMDGQLSILLGNGDGTFKPPTNYARVNGVGIAAADFNGDGILDLVTTTETNTVCVLLGNGDGTFRTPLTSKLTAVAEFIAVGDFNGDHKPDIVVIDAPYISVLLGNGDGTLQAPSDNASFENPQSLAIGDFNNDHKLDIATVGSFSSASAIGILSGNGDGTLLDSVNHPITFAPCSVAAADLNRDGDLDIAVGGCGDGLTIFLGEGNGSFQPGATYVTTGGAGQVAIADINGDHKPDVLFSSAIPPGLNELLGNGDGTLASAQFFPAGQFAGSLGVGDFNADHMMDVAYIDRELGAITMLNTGVVTFSPSAPLTFPTQLIGTASAPLTATLTNNGTAPLTFSSVSYSGKPFRAQTTCKGSIAPGGSCTVNVTFLAQAEGVASGTLTLHDSASSKPQVMELIGTGTVVQFTPPQLTFPPQKEGTQSPAKTIRLTNTGSIALDFTHTIEIGGPDNFNFFESDNCPTSLGAGASCTIHVVFAPRQKGQITQSIVAIDNGGGSPQSAPLFGTAN